MRSKAKKSKVVVSKKASKSKSKSKKTVKSKPKSAKSKTNLDQRAVLSQASQSFEASSEVVSSVCCSGGCTSPCSGDCSVCCPSGCDQVCRSSGCASVLSESSEQVATEANASAGPSAPNPQETSTEPAGKEDSIFRRTWSWLVSLVKG